MKHYCIKHNTCTINICSFTYKGAFNWSIYTRTLDEIYDKIIEYNISEVVFKNFDKLFKVTKTSRERSHKTKRTLVEAIVNYTYTILDMFGGCEWWTWDSDSNVVIKSA